VKIAKRETLALGFNILMLLMEKTLKFVLLLTPFTVLFFSVNMFFPFIAPKMLALEGLILIGVLAWLYLWYNNPDKYKPHITWLTVSIGIYTLINFIAALQGANFWRSFWSRFERMDGVFTWIALFLLLVILNALYQKREDWIWIFRISLGVSVVIGLRALEFFGIPEGTLSVPTQISAIFGSPIYIGVYAMFHIVFSVLLLRLLLDDRYIRTFRDILLLIKNPWGLFYVFTLVMNIFVLFMSFARAVAGGFLVGVLVFIAWYMLFGKERRVLSYTVGVVAVLILLSFPLWKDFSLATRLSSLSQGPFSDETRNINWNVGYQAFLGSPLLGWGMDNYFVAQNEFYNPHLQSLIQQNFDKPHNKYIEVAVDSGLLGLASYTAIFVLLLIMLFRHRREEPFLTALLAALFGAYLTQNLTAFDSPGSYMPLFLLLAFINSEFFTPVKFQLRPYPVLVAGSWFIILALIWQGVVQPYQQNRSLTEALIVQAHSPDRQEQVLEAYRKALFYQSLGDYETRIQLGTFVLNQPRILNELLDYAIAEIEKERIFSPRDNLIGLMLAKLYELKSSSPEYTEYLQKADEAFRQVVAITPQNPRNYQHYSRFLLNSGKHEEARNQLFQIQKINTDVFDKPENQWVLIMSYVQQGSNQEPYEIMTGMFSQGILYSGADKMPTVTEVFTRLGRQEEMIELYRKAFYETNPNNGNYALDLGDAYRHIGNNEEARKHFEKAIELYPDRPETVQQAQALLKSLE
jgi:tetratricopeptide (TPR) repeat protein